MLRNFPLGCKDSYLVKHRKCRFYLNVFCIDYTTDWIVFDSTAGTVIYQVLG